MSDELILSLPSVAIDPRIGLFHANYFTNLCKLTASLLSVEKVKRSVNLLNHIY